MKKQIENKQEVSLNLEDLLTNQKTDELSDYLSLSIESLGEDTKVTVKTLEDHPVIYSSTFSGMPFVNPHAALGGSSY